MAETSLETLFQYPEALRAGKLVKRYKRFLMDVKLPDDTVETVHCANSGSMKSCLEDNADVFTLDSHNPKRKLQHSLEIMGLSDGLACLNTARANKVVESFLNAVIADISALNDIQSSPDFSKFIEKYTSVKAESTFKKGTRFDFQAMADDANAWIEVKSVSLREDFGVSFPDAVTTRGQKHLEHLMEAVDTGSEAALFFVVMRGQNEDVQTLCRGFQPAAHIDARYAELLQQALDKGVKVFVLAANITLEGIGIRGVFPYNG